MLGAKYLYLTHNDLSSAVLVEESFRCWSERTAGSKPCRIARILLICWLFRKPGRFLFGVLFLVACALICETVSQQM